MDRLVCPDRRVQLRLWRGSDPFLDPITAAELQRYVIPGS
jgi:hypothetical protein